MDRQAVREESKLTRRKRPHREIRDLKPDWRLSAAARPDNRPALPTCKAAAPDCDAADDGCKAAGGTCKAASDRGEAAIERCKAAALTCKAAAPDWGVAAPDCEVAAPDCEVAADRCKAAGANCKAAAQRGKPQRGAAALLQTSPRRSAARPASKDGGKVAAVPLLPSPHCRLLRAACLIRTEQPIRFRPRYYSATPPHSRRPRLNLWRVC